MKPWLLVIALSLVACGGSPSDVTDEDYLPDVSERGTFQLRIDTDGGFRRGVNAFTVRAFTSSGAPAERLEVSARMPGHAHAVVRPTVRAVADGWRVDDLEMTMPGRWIITLRLTHEAAQDEALAVTSLR